jgi:sigma-B regulation protein RsbU (phosphoserine phosphatase)
MEHLFFAFSDINRRNKMTIDLMDDIRRGLEEKRSVVSECCEVEEESPELITEAQTHLQVIDTSLQKLDEGTLGICTVCHGTVDDALLEMDYTACVCLDDFSTQERRALENELELSQVVQRAMMPQQIPNIAGYDIAGYNRPAQIIGGDYYDFFQFNDGAHGFVVADISGKGVSGGMLMTSLQTAFHTLVPETDSPTRVLEKINRLYIHNIHFTTYVTIFFARLNADTRSLLYANAGHNPALLYRGAGKTRNWLRPTGAAIGLMEKFNVRSESLQLEGGDIFVLYTDGITEAINSKREEFGRERLADIIEQNETLSAEALIQKILQSLNDFTEGNQLADDITLVIYKVK